MSPDMNPDDNPFVIPESDEPVGGPSASTVPPPFPGAAARPRWVPPREPICGGCAAPQKEPRVFIPFLKKSMTVALILPLAILLFFFVLGLLLSGMRVISMISMGDMGSEIDNPDVTEKVLSGDDFLPHKIAVLPIEGIITENEDGFIRQAIRTAYEDADIDALVLRVNSPGGTMTGSDYYYTLLKQLKEERSIPIIVSMGPVSASGGYYVSIAGDKIFAERSTVSGSIGVICEIP
ncbi:MAG: S49 family peptidase, partial [Thermoguttaceae bacterium]|nr:S49 family peptidase [Thermoguttaceae bacterium]